MAVSSKGRARGTDLRLQSVTLVDLNYSDTKPLLGDVAAAPETAALAFCPAMSIGLPADFAAADQAPRYDKRLRQLWLGGLLLRTVSKRRSNQAFILAAFEEEGWPELIDDPLRPAVDVEPHKQLRDTLYALNRAILAHADPRARQLVKFHAENDSEAIRRQTIAAPRAAAATLPLAVWRPATATSMAHDRPRRCK